MSFFKEQIKPAWRTLSSIACAFRCKAVAVVAGRKPSKTCQVPDLDKIATNRFGPSRSGVFVEVGAYDGERFSNTSWLADNGWKGIYVEPSKQFSRWCRLRHLLNNVTVHRVAAGKEDAQTTLIQMGSLSTMSHETFDEYGRIPWAKKQMQKECRRQETRIRSLDSILLESQLTPGFEMLVVDVEGYEEQVFQGFDINYWEPQMLIVELCDVHPDFSANKNLIESARRVRSDIFAAGYTEVYRDQINTVFERPRVESARTERPPSGAAGALPRLKIEADSVDRLRSNPDHDGRPEEQVESGKPSIPC